MFVKKYLTLILCYSLLAAVFIATSAEARDISFAWAANQEQVDGYKLYYDTDTAGTPYEGTGAQEGDSPVTITGQQSTQATLHDLSNTTTYHFTLTAFRGSEESAYSTEIIVQPESSNNGEVTAHFVWTPNTESTLDGYKIHYGTASGTYTKVADIGNPTLGADNKIHGDIEHLAEGTTYYFVCTAYDTQGNESGYSQEITWTATGQSTANPPVADNGSVSTNENTTVTGTDSSTVTPHDDNGTSDQVTVNNSPKTDGSPASIPATTTPNLSEAGKSVQFQWAANQEQIDGYKLYYKTGTEGGPEYNGTGANEGNSPIDVGNTTSFNLSGLQADKRYYFAITAYKGNEESTYSKEIVLWTGDTPAAPIIMNIIDVK